MLAALCICMIVEIDLIHKGIKTLYSTFTPPTAPYVEIDLIHKGIKTQRAALIEQLSKM